MVSLARKTLVYEWRRFAAAVAALAFSGLLMLVQAGLLYGMFESFSLPVDRARAELWVTAPNVQSFDQSTVVAARFEGRLWAHPDVVAVEGATEGGGDWRTGDGRKQSVYIIGVDTRSGSLTQLRGISDALREALRQPATVVVDRADLGKLGVAVGGSAEINGQRVQVVGTVEGFRTSYGANIFASPATLRLLSGNDPSIEGPPRFLVRLRPGADAAAVRDALQPGGESPPFQVWLQDELSAASKSFWLAESGSGASFGFSMLLATLVGVGVTSQTLRAAVLATLKEYAALRALGVRMGRLRLIVLEQSLWVAAVGLVALTLVTLAIDQLAAAMAVPMLFPWWVSLCTALFVLVVAAVSGLLALRVLAGTEPADLLR